MTLANPSIADVIVEAADAIRAPVYVARVAEVTGFDRGRGTVSVRPLVSARLDGGQYEPVPTFGEVPVYYMRCGGFSVTADVAVGQLGLILVRDVSHDEVDAGDTQYPVEPAAGRRHSLSDAVFLPGFVPPGDGPPSGTTAANRLVLALPSGAAVAVGAGSAAFNVSRDDRVQGELDKLSATIASLTSPSGPVTAGTPYVKGTTSTTRLKVDG